jgi:4-amino-4-deoxy-L-arabinose transferase-like glycosyltransferase
MNARDATRSRLAATVRLWSHGFDRRQLVVPLLLIVFAAGLRFGTFAMFPPERLIADEIYYAEVARGLALGEGHHYRDAFDVDARAWRPPGHPFLLSQWLSAERAAGVDDRVASVQPLLWFQLLLGSLLVVGVWALGWVCFGERVALGAGLAAAVYPNLIFFSHSLWSETLTALLLVAALVGAVRWRATPTARVAVSTGLVLGLAALTREVALGVAVAIGVWWILEAQPAGRLRAARHGLLVCVVAMLVVAPWTLRNARVLGAFVPVSTIGWFAAGEGNTFEASNWLADRGPMHLVYKARYFQTPGELARADVAKRWTFQRVAEEQPDWALRKLVREGALLLSPDTYLRYKIDAGAYGEVDAGLRLALVVVAGGAWLVLAFFSALGVAVAPAPQRHLALLVLAVPGAVHLLTNATSRFRAPWLPLLLVFAAYAWQERGGLRQQLSRRGGHAVLAVVAFVGLVALPYYLYFGGRI